MYNILHFFFNINMYVGMYMLFTNNPIGNLKKFELVLTKTHNEG